MKFELLAKRLVGPVVFFNGAQQTSFFYLFIITGWLDFRLAWYYNGIPPTQINVIEGLFREHNSKDSCSLKLIRMQTEFVVVRNKIMMQIFKIRFSLLK